MNLQANPRSPHITVTPASNQILSSLSRDRTSHSVVYEVTGVAVGTAQLVFNATTTSGRVISSLPREIQVFDALQLLPKRITLLPTATFQVVYHTSLDSRPREKPGNRGYLSCLNFSCCASDITTCVF